MEQFIKEYLPKVDITTNTLSERVSFLYEVASKMCPEKIERIFIDDYINEDKSRGYESIWFFSKRFILEAHDFETKYELDIVPIIVYRFLIQLKDYDFCEATEESRMRVFITFGGDITGELKAAKENCDILRDIVFTYIQPKLSS